jgi:hypothetical protein
MKTPTQKQQILKLLQENPAGVNSFGVARELALQLPTRIFELKKSHNIISTPKSDGSVDYVLMDAPVKKITRYEFQGSTAIPVYE